MSKSHNSHVSPTIAQPATTPSSPATGMSPPAPRSRLDLPASPTVTPDRIRPRAYELYQSRTASGTYGTPTDDWLTAERELISRSPDSTITQDIELKTRSHAGLLHA